MTSTTFPWLWLSYAYELLDELTGASVYVAQSRAAWQGWFGESLLRTLAALLLVASMLVVSVRAARLLLPAGTGIPLRWASVFGIGSWLATLGFHVLRALGLFDLFSSLLCAVGLLALAGYAAPTRAPAAWALGRELRALTAVTRLFYRHRYAPSTAIFAGLALLAAARSSLIPPLGWDTLTYHGPRAVQWVQTGQFTFSLGPGPLDLYRHFFSGSEVLTAWAMLPFHSDLAVNLGTFAQWLWAGLAVWAFARVIGVREPFAATSAGAVMFIPTLQLELGTAYAEPMLAGALLHGLGLALTCLRRPTGPTALIAAASLGTAAGVKLLGGLAGVLVAVVLALRLLFTKTLPVHKRGLWFLASAACLSLPSLPWMMNAWWETGFPLSPMPIEVLGVTLGESGPSLRWYQDRPGIVPYLWMLEKRALLTMLAPVGTSNEALGVLAIIPVLALPLGSVALVRRRPVLGVLTIATALTPVLFHFSTSLTVPRLLWSVSVSRYLTLFLAVAIPASLAWCRAQGPLSQAYRRLLLCYPLLYAIFFLRWGWSLWEYRELTVLFMLWALLAALLGWGFRGSRRRALATTLAAVLVTTPFLQLRRDATRFQAFGTSFALHGFPNHWAYAVPWVDEPGKVHQIALTGGPSQPAHDWFFYAFLGSRFQNRIDYVPPTKDGGIAHFGPYGDFAQRADEESWLTRLRRRGITEVLTFIPRSIEQDWMEQHPERFQKLAGDHEWGLFRRLQ